MSWLLILGAYLLGSVSFAWLAAKSKGLDLRQHGSGNLGATNVGRVMGRSWFFVVFFADLAKGLLPVLLALMLVEQQQAFPSLPVLVGAAAILGHIFTCFHGFKGGKAVATALGVLIALVYMAAAIAFGVWLLVWGIRLCRFSTETQRSGWSRVDHRRPHGTDCPSLNVSLSVGRCQFTAHPLYFSRRDPGHCATSIEHC
jgi:acyl-phosphate glycerol 3-phosphate acyltransferase